MPLTDRTETYDITVIMRDKFWDQDQATWFNRMLARLRAEDDIPCPERFEELVTVEDLEFLRSMSVDPYRE